MAAKDEDVIVIDEEEAPVKNTVDASDDVLILSSAGGVRDSPSFKTQRTAATARKRRISQRSASVEILDEELPAVICSCKGNTTSKDNCIVIGNGQNGDLCSRRPDSTRTTTCKTSVVSNGTPEVFICEERSKRTLRTLSPANPPSTSTTITTSTATTPSVAITPPVNVTIPPVPITGLNSSVPAPPLSHMLSHLSSQLNSSSSAPPLSHVGPTLSHLPSQFNSSSAPPLSHVSPTPSQLKSSSSKRSSKRRSSARSKPKSKPSSTKPSSTKLELDYKSSLSIPFLKGSDSDSPSSLIPSDAYCSSLPPAIQFIVSPSIPFMTCNAPLWWTKAKLAEISLNDSEARTVTYPLEYSGFKILKLERIQTLHLWIRYLCEVKLLVQSRGEAFILNEAILYHCSRGSRDAICDEGLDSRLGHGGNFGRGIYFR